jgi:hypothetical protein
MVDNQDIKRAVMLVMLGLLVYTAPQWLFTKEQPRQAAYDAPWIYPGLLPPVQR